MTDDNIDDFNVLKEMKENQNIGLNSIFIYLKLGKSLYIVILIVTMITQMFVEGYSFYFYNTAVKNGDNDFDPYYFLKVFVIL